MNSYSYTAEHSNRFEVSWFVTIQLEVKVTQWSVEVLSS